MMMPQKRSMMTHGFLLAFTTMLFWTGCFGPSGEICEGDIRLAQEVYYGTLLPSHVPLEPGQILAIGDFNGCSGTLIAPRWVLSADHCRLNPGVRFCMGEQPDDPNICLTVVRVIAHPQNDLALAELETDAVVEVPGLQPIPIMTDRMDASWLGRLAEAAGYGQTEDGTLGTRYFVTEPIVDLNGSFLTVDGDGSSGLCRGDSGGPVMVIAPDATVRVAGALYGGDASCVGRDSYTRTDLAREWIETYTGPTVAQPGSCGSIDAVGACFSADTALWCEGGTVLRSETCAEGTRCGWDDAAAAFRCIAGPDPCEGYDRRGGCDGAVAYWCESGALRARDCGSCGETCDPFATTAGVYCRHDACMGLDYQGRCNGSVAEWCDSGALRTYDCAADGQSCGYINDDLGYYCLAV
jgi:hypothetical protein